MRRNNMTFPNAAKGIKKIFTSEILNLVSLLAVGIMTVFSVIFTGNANSGNDVAAGVSGIGFLVFAIAAGVITIIAWIFKVIGVIQTSKDEPSYKLIIYLAIFSLAISFIAALFSGNTLLYNIVSAITSVINFITSLLIIVGIGHMAVQLQDTEVVTKCGSLLRTVLWIGILAILTRFFSIFMPSTAAKIIVIALAIISMILTVVQYVLYLSLLSKTKKMLEQ
jgi:hypothetical protein